MTGYVHYAAWARRRLHRFDGYQVTLIKTIFRLISGITLILMGLLFISAYVSEAVIAPLGEPDQSLLFGYLPLLIAGLFTAALGALITWIGYREYRGQRSHNQ